jgi:hypothetical protein
MSVQNPLARNRETVLEDDMTFAVSLLTNSLRKTTAWFMEKGVYNPYSGTPFTQQGLYQSLRRSPAFLEFRHRRDVRHEISGEEPTLEEIEWAKKCIIENLPKVLNHVKTLDARLKALGQMNQENIEDVQPVTE